MKRVFKLLSITLIVLLAVALTAVGAALWLVHSKLPQRNGTLSLSQLKATVTVSYDERGVPHIRAENEPDLYRALGYVHAQDRLFQMEMVRRLARGELAEILGPKLLDTDRLFRTLGLRAHADATIARLDMSRPANQALLAYLDGVNQFQATRAVPLEFQILGIPTRPFTPADTIAVSGYLAYSFAAAFRTEPVLTFVRDKLGAGHLRIFDLDWKPQGAPGSANQGSPVAHMSPADWGALSRVAALSLDALTLARVPQFEGSNAWAISGRRTESGKPLLGGDPHIAYATPSVWYEAHLSAPGFELYGHHQALNPTALLGHNAQFGWSLTMFQNDDVDLVAEKLNPANANQVWHHGQWVDLQNRQESIAVKGATPVSITVRRSPHGPLIHEVFPDAKAQTPLALWWTFLETENPLLDAFYELNRANTPVKAAQAASKIHAPGLNIVWANAAGDIGWWAAAKLAQRATKTNPSFILDGSTVEADKLGFYPFADNPQEVNPERGYIVSANHQPVAHSGVPVPGYYNLPERAQRLDQLLRQPNVLWNLHNSQALQLDERTGYGPRVLQPLLPALRASASDATERVLIDQLANWDGRHSMESTAPTVFNHFLYELAKSAMVDELGETQFSNLLRTRALDHALPRLSADATSPWWDKQTTPAVETRNDIVKAAWRATVSHLQSALGVSTVNWTWGQAHTLTHNHPLGQQKPLDRLFNVGPYAVPGGREIPNNLSHPIGPAPWAVNYGPSTRRLIDFADASKALGINPVGQSGVLLDAHYADQATTFAQGGYQPMHLGAADVTASTRSTLVLQPVR